MFKPHLKFDLKLLCVVQALISISLLLSQKRQFVQEINLNEEIQWPVLTSLVLLEVPPMSSVKLRGGGTIPYLILSLIQYVLLSRLLLMPRVFMLQSSVFLVRQLVKS